MQTLKKGLALALALVLCLSLCSVGVFAEDDAAAALAAAEAEDTIEWGTAAEVKNATAFTTALNGTDPVYVKLTGGISLSQELEINGKVKIDLNGKELAPKTLKVTGTGYLVIEDSAFAKGGSKQNVDYSKGKLKPDGGGGQVQVEQSGTLIVESGTIWGGGYYTSALVSSGKVIFKGTETAYAAVINGNTGYATASAVEINSGTFVVKGSAKVLGGSGIKVNNASLYVKDDSGVFSNMSSGYTVYVESGSATLSGGTFGKVKNSGGGSIKRESTAKLSIQGNAVIRCSIDKSCEGDVTGGVIVSDALIKPVNCAEGYRQVKLTENDLHGYDAKYVGYTAVTNAPVDISNSTVGKLGQADVTIGPHLGTFTYTSNAIAPWDVDKFVVVLYRDTLVYGTDYTVEYKDNVNAGTAQVVFKGTGNYTGEIVMEFTIIPATVTLTYNGTGPATGAPEDAKITYTSNNEDVAIVDANGVVTTLTGTAGTAIITASYAGDDNHEAATAKKEYTVLAFGDEAIVVTGYSHEYDGEAHGITVEAPEDATVEYSTEPFTATREVLELREEALTMDVPATNELTEIEDSDENDAEEIAEDVEDAEVEDDAEIVEDDAEDADARDNAEDAEGDTEDAAIEDDAKTATLESFGGFRLFAAEDAVISYTDVGTYPVYYKVSAEGYADVTGSADVIITPKAVTVTADNKTKDYGADDPELTATVEGLIGDDTIRYELERATGEAASTSYAITVTGEAEQGNYAVTFVNGTLTIGAAPVDNTPTPTPAPVNDSGDYYDDTPSAPSPTTPVGETEQTVEIEDEATPLAALPDSFDTLTVTIGDEEVPLADIPLAYNDVAVESWARDAIAFVTATGIMIGTAEDGTEFAPEASATGEMLTIMVGRLLGEEAVDEALTEGIAYDPYEAASREQLITILYRAAAAEGYDVSAGADLSGFSDAGDLSEFAQAAMQWAVSIGLIKGMGDGTLNATGSVTREQIATIFMRYSILLGK